MTWYAASQHQSERFLIRRADAGIAVKRDNLGFSCQLKVRVSGNLFEVEGHAFIAAGDLPAISCESY
ncbi:hypothetical protein D3C78_1026260 [compost metagenome]